MSWHRNDNICSGRDSFLAVPDHVAPPVRCLQLASMMPQNGASAGGDADSDGVADEISLDGGGIVDRIEGVVI